MASRWLRLQRIEGRCAADLARVGERERWAQQRVLERLTDADLDAMAELVQAMDAGATPTADQEALLARFDQPVAEVTNG